jgi:hypothetical protein
MPTNPLNLTSELDAVNLMLRAIGESRVLTLEDATHEDAADALELLRHWNMTVQEEGWRFNSRDNVLFTRNVDNEILIPAATLRVEAAGDSYCTPISFINGKLFDVEKNTFTWTQDIFLDYVIHYPFDQIPQSARNYIVQLAGLEYIGNEASSSGRANFSQARMVAARAALRRTESKIRKPNMLTGSFHTAYIRAGRRPFTL